MNTNAVNIAVVDGKTITEATALKVADSGKPVRIKAIENGKYVLAEGDKGVAPENITIKRVGKDLHIALEGTDPDQPQLIIEGFFDAQGQLVGVGEDGAYYEYISSDAEQDHSAAFLIEGVSSPQVLGSEQLVGFGDGLVAGAGIGWFWPAVLGLAGVGVLGAAYAASQDDGGNNNDHGLGSTTRPNTPSLSDVHDNAGNKTGLIERGGVTDDSTPTFSGEGTPGNTIIIRDGDTIIGEVVVGEDGSWEFTPETPLDGGPHDIVLVEKDPAGNESEPSDGFEFTVDLTAPGKAVITDAQDNFGDNQGTVAQNGVTDDNTPTLRGTAEAGATVEIFANGVKIGEAPVNADGSWAFTPVSALADDQYSFTTVAVDAAGNRGLESDPYVLTIDTDGSALEISITGATDNEGTVQDPLSNGSVTDDTTPTLNGQATANATVTIYGSDGLPIGTTTADTSGKWSFEIPTLTEGHHSFTATATTPAGGESAPTAAFNLEIDLTPPVKPDPSTPGTPSNGGIDAVLDDFGVIQDPIPNGGSTDDTTPTLVGRGQPGDKVIIKDNGEIIGTEFVKNDGTWSFTPDPLNPGPHDFTIIVTDPAGNASLESDPYTVIVDTSEPAQPAITSVFDDQGGVTGNMNPGDTTDDAHPEISGTAEPGSIVIIYDNNVEIGREPVDGDGNWSFSSPLLHNGSHSLTVKAMDEAGNISSASDPFNFDVLTGGVPTAPAITGITDDVGVPSNVSPGDVTNDVRPTIHGTGQAGQTITVYANGLPVGTTTVQDDGRWSVEVNRDLDEGLNNISAIATDLAGNQGPETGDYPITVDITDPDPVETQILMDDVGTVAQINDGDTTDDSTPTFSGTAEPGTTVIIYDAGIAIGRAPVNSSGQWSFPSRELSPGPHSFSTVVEDAAGNKSAPSPAINFIVDTSAVVISITGATDNEGAVQDPLHNGSVTDDTTPTLNGQATANATVTIYGSDGLPIGTTTADTSGKWSFEIPTLTEGHHSFTATATTPAGGESAPTAAFNLEIDLTPPVKPDPSTPGTPSNGGIDAVLDDVGLIQDPIPNGGSTDDTTPTLVGRGQPGDKVTIKENGAIIGTEIVKDDGTWSFTPDPLNPGPHDFTIIVTDPAGNASLESDPYTVIVDTSIVTPVINRLHDNVGTAEDIPNGGSTDDRRPTLFGEAEPFSQVTIYIDGLPVDTVGADDQGNWDYDLAADLSVDVHSIYVVAEDTVGNSAQSATWNVTVVSPGPSGNEDWESVGGGTLIPGNDYDLASGLTVVAQRVYGSNNATVRTGGIEGYGNKQLQINDGTLVEFKLGGAEQFSFNYGHYSQGADVGMIYYTDGTSAQFGVGYATGPWGTYSHVAPAGKEIESFSLYIRSDGGLPGTMIVDEISWGDSASNLAANQEQNTPTDNHPESYLGEDKEGDASDSNDLFLISDTAVFNSSDSTIDGHAGLDVLRLTGSDQVLDLTALGDRINSIESIDLTGSGDNTLKLSVEDVLNHGGTDLFHDSGKSQMMVNGNAGDEVDLQGLIGAEDPGSWGSQGSVMVGGVVYEVFSHSSLDAELLVQQGVTTNLV